MFRYVSHLATRIPGTPVHGIRSPIAVGLFLVCLSGCASTRLEPLTDRTHPASLGQDERTLWAVADRLESQIAACVGPAAGHEQVEQYLSEILRNLTPDFDNPDVRVRIRVLPDTSPNAFVLPNGAMYVNTGLLALLENEAQIATVLGHEFAHFRNRHSYREKIKEDNEFVKGILFGGTLGVLAGSPDRANSLAELWRISSVCGYSRELESEADHLSLIALVKAGYQPEQAIKAFERLLGLAGGPDEENRQFATHPKLSERIDSYNRWLREPEVQQYAAGNMVAQDVYNAKLFDLTLANAELNLEEENYALAQANIDRCLRLQPGCGRAHYLRGEFLRCGPTLDEDPWQGAVESYERALRCDPNCVDAHREMGLLYRQLGNRDKARESLAIYLERAGRAADAPLVKSCLDRLADPNAAPRSPYRAPRITAEDLRTKAKTVGVIPVFMPDGILNAEKRGKELEETLVGQLRRAGFTVVPSSEYEAIYESMRKSMGALYDPNTGVLLEDRQRAVLDHAFREYTATHQVDALVFPAVVTVGAKWDTNRATWDGVQEATTGKEGFWANMAAPSAYGTIQALSFRVNITSAYGELCYQGFGGIQLCSRVAGRDFVDVPVHEILADPARNARSVEIACRNLLGKTP